MGYFSPSSPSTAPSPLSVNNEWTWLLQKKNILYITSPLLQSKMQRIGLSEPAMLYCTDQFVIIGIGTCVHTRASVCRHTLCAGVLQKANQGTECLLMHSTSNYIFTAGTILQVMVKSYPIHPLMKQQSKVYS